MFSLKKNLKFISIDQKYLKYLHDFCKEVYYLPTGYETKPYLGILVEDKGMEYVDKQISTGKILNFCCDFRLLEKKSKEYTTK